MFKGKVQLWGKDDVGEYTRFLKESPNLWVDDGKELVQDFLWGIKSWWNPLEQGEYGSGNIGWDISRWVGFGTMMFNNSSFERASGIHGIPTGEEYNYPVASTFLVSTEDSFLSAEVGNRVSVTCTRTDQVVQISALVHVPSDIQVSTKIREFSMFLQATGPTNDPSQYDPAKPFGMICRSALYGTGWFDAGGPAAEEDSGARVCYFDDYYEVDDDIQIRWLFGDI